MDLSSYKKVCCCSTALSYCYLITCVIPCSGFRMSSYHRHNWEKSVEDRSGFALAQKRCSSAMKLLRLRMTSNVHVHVVM